MEALWVMAFVQACWWAFSCPAWKRRVCAEPIAHSSPDAAGKSASPGAVSLPGEAEISCGPFLSAYHCQLPSGQYWCDRPVSVAGALAGGAAALPVGCRHGVLFRSASCFRRCCSASPESTVPVDGRSVPRLHESCVHCLAMAWLSARLAGWFSGASSPDACSGTGRNSATSSRNRRRE